MRKKTKEEFIRDAKLVHGDKCDYSKVEYVNNYTNVDIYCKEHQWFKQTPKNHLKFGCIRCNRPLIWGVGINTTDPSPENKRPRIIWTEMLKRCYSKDYIEKEPTYKGCIVCEEWKYFDNLKSWVYNPENGYKDGYHLDKDILVKGNKVYSPETCCFVPREINILFAKRQNHRGECRIGVTKRNRLYEARVSNGNRNIVRIGSYITEELAFFAYKEAKEKHIKEVANKWKDKIAPNVYDALMNYQVEITD